MTMNAMSFSGARMTGAHMARARMTDQFRARMAGAHLGTRRLKLPGSWHFLICMFILYIILHVYTMYTFI